MALPDIDTGTIVTAQLASECVPVGNPCIFFDASSTSKYSHVFEVKDEPLQIIAFDLPEGDSITLEMVWGEGGGQFFAPVVVGEAFFEIAHPNNVMMIPMEGRFRLRYDGELGDVTVVCSPTSCCVAQIFPGAERMTALTPAQLADRLGFRSCSEQAITPGQRLATCVDLSDMRDDILALIPTVPAPPTTLPPSGPAGGALNGSYPNPGLVPVATLAATGLRDCDGAALVVGAQVATCADLSEAIAAIPPGSTAPTGPASGALNGNYPAPGLVPAAVVTATGFIDCDGAALTPGVALATCTDLADAIAGVGGGGGSGSPTGPAGGALNGTYPSPGLVPAAVATALAQVDCDGNPIGVGATLATCDNLADAIAAIPPGGSSTPTGPAGGGLNGTYPNPGLVPAAVATAHGLVDCNGDPIGVGAAVATCADLASASVTSGADFFTVAGVRQHWGNVGPINLASTPQTNPVLFATAFPTGQIPVNIQLTPLGNTDGGDSDDEAYWVIPGSATETGFSIGTRGDGPAVSFHYLAIAPAVSGGGGGGGGGTIAPLNIGAFPIVENTSSGTAVLRTEALSGGPFTSVALLNDGGTFPSWLNITNDGAGGGGHQISLNGNATGVGTFTFSIQVCNAGGCQTFTGNEIEVI